MMAIPLVIPKPVAMGAEQSLRRRTIICAGTAISNSKTLPRINPQEEKQGFSGYWNRENRPRSPSCVSLSDVFKEAMPTRGVYSHREIGQCGHEQHHENHGVEERYD